MLETIWFVLWGVLWAVYFMLEKAHILTAPGSGFGRCGEGYVRFSLTEPDARLREAMRRLSKLDWSPLK